MKLSVSLVSSLLLATLSHAMQPYQDYNWQLQNAIPYQHLLTEDEIVNYSVLAFDMSREELTELIRRDLVARDLLHDEAEAIPVPVHDMNGHVPPMPVSLMTIIIITTPITPISHSMCRLSCHMVAMARW